MMRFMRLPFAALAVTTALASTVSAGTLQPAAVLPSSLLVDLAFVAQGVPAERKNDIASPVAIGSDLYFVDKRNARLSVRHGDGSSQTLIDASTLPAGLTPPTTAGLRQVGIVNIAGDSDRAYVTYYSSTLPTGFDRPASLPADARYATTEPRFEVIYAYDRAPDGTLNNPEPLTAFAASTGGHHSGGMLVLPDGDLLYARGDNLSQHYDGLSAPQELDNTLSKLLIINTDTGASQIAAQGVRNVQTMTYTDPTRTQIAFSDIGWTVAEEINQISLADILDTATVENFGWGRNADGLAREGTFYVNTGPSDDAEATGQAPQGEAGFVQPFAEFGRDGFDGFFAVSGPVASQRSFDRIGFLFGDLASGGLFATLDGASGTGNDVFSVMVRGPNGQPTTISDLFGPQRDEPRFFNFADGTAGLLFERTGGIYRITEVSVAAVPLAASGLLLGSVLAFGGLVGRRRKSVL